MLFNPCPVGCLAGVLSILTGTPAPSELVEAPTRPCPELSWFSEGAREEPEPQELLLRIANPLATLFSVQAELEFENDVGPHESDVTSVRLRPIVPVSLSEEWDLICRTQVSVEWEDVPQAEDEFGLSDLDQSFLFSPAALASGRSIWGVGPMFRLPTATSDELGDDQLGLGVTAAWVLQSGPWTFSALGHHLRKVSGSDRSPDLEETLLRPEVSFTLSGSWTVGIKSEIVYDGAAEEAEVPVTIEFEKLLGGESSPFTLGASLTRWVEESDASPEGWSLGVSVRWVGDR